MSPKGDLSIVGGTGFIGSAIAKRAEMQGSFTKIARLGRAQMDLLDSQKTLQWAPNLSGTLILAPAIRRELGESPETFEQNSIITANLSRLLLKIPKGALKRVLILSSAAVYGEDIENLSISESTPVSPRSWYGISKYMFEVSLRKVLREQGISHMTLRPPAVYGPGEKYVSYNPAGFVRTLKEGKTLTLWGDGSEKREHLFIDDCVEYCLRAIQSDAQGILNLVSGKSVTFMDVLREIESVSGNSFKDKISKRERTKSKVDHGYDPSRTFEVLGPHKFVDLKEGVLRLCHDQSTQQG